MTPGALIAFRDEIKNRYDLAIGQVAELDPASEDVESKDYRADIYSEALFLRAFTAYERNVEAAFLHYVTGGVSIDGKKANRYLSITDESHARKMTRAGYKFLSWGKPHEIKATAENYIENGWPISDMMNAKSQELRG